jgi:hypothetical protein
MPLAALIRDVGGSHTLGAAALAEALVDRGVTVTATRQAEEIPVRGDEVTNETGGNGFDVDGVVVAALDAQLNAITAALAERPAVNPRLTAVTAATEYRETRRRAIERQAAEEEAAARAAARVAAPVMPQVPHADTRQSSPVKGVEEWGPTSGQNIR